MNENSEILTDPARQFDLIWKVYPNKDGRKAALNHFKASVKTVNDLAMLMIAIKNYLNSVNVKKGFIKSGSTFFNNWQDWFEPTSVMMFGGGRSTPSPKDQLDMWAKNDQE